MRNRRAECKYRAERNVKQTPILLAPPQEAQCTYTEDWRFQTVMLRQQFKNTVIQLKNTADVDASTRSTPEHFAVTENTRRTPATCQVWSNAASLLLMDHRLLNHFGITTIDRLRSLWSINHVILFSHVMDCRLLNRL